MISFRIRVRIRVRFKINVRIKWYDRSLKEISFHLRLLS